MTESIKSPFNLVPEIAILAPLPRHYRQRYKTALELMHGSLSESLSWELIAQKSAISPYHFHRQFCQLFHQTPGQYLSRIRLQRAAHLLFSDNEHKVVDIALECGYSSSQALAKVLKRELGVTAKDLRSQKKEGNPKQTFQLLKKLSHPVNTSTMEKQLAQAMPSELIWYPSRGIKVIPYPDFDWDKAYEHYGAASLQFLSATPVSELSNAWKDMEFTIGDWSAASEEQDYFIPEGYYFCCEVYLVNDTGYLAAIDGLFHQAEDCGYQINTKGFFIEMMRNVEEKIGHGATFSFQVPIVV